MVLDAKRREASQKRRTKRQCIPQAVQPGDERGRWTAVDEAETGKPFEAKLYRGEGNAPQEAARNRTPSQYGVGQYWSPNEEVSGTYGPRVRSEIVRPENPYVFDLGTKEPYFAELRREFGTSDPVGITNKLQAQGHDGIIVRNVPVMRGEVSRMSAEVIRFAHLSDAQSPKTGLELLKCSESRKSSSPRVKDEQRTGRNTSVQ